jgi:hypothetical protein
MSPATSVPVAAGPASIPPSITIAAAIASSAITSVGRVGTAPAAITTPATQLRAEAGMEPNKIRLVRPKRIDFRRISIMSFSIMARLS